MADILFLCPACRQDLVVDQTGAGLTIQCPQCAQGVKVPDKGSTGLIRVPELEALRTRAGDLQTVIRRAETEREQLRHALETQTTALREEAARERARAEEALRDRATLGERLAQFEGPNPPHRAEIRRLAQELVKSQQALRDRKRESESAQGEQQKQRDALRQMLSESHEQARQLGIARGRIETLENELRESQRQRAAAAEAMAAHTVSQDSANRRIAELEAVSGRLDSLERERTDLLGRLESSESAFREVGGKLEAERVRAEALAKELEAAQAEEGGLRGAFEAEKVCRNNAEERLQSVEREFVALREKSLGLTRELHETRQRVEPLSTELARVQKTLEASESRYAEARAALGATHERIRNAEREREQALGLQRTADERFAGASCELDTVRADRDRLGARVEGLNAEITRAERITAGAITDREKAAAELEETRKDLETAHSLAAGMEQTVQRLTQELATAAEAAVRNETALYHSRSAREGLESMLRGVRANLAGTTEMYERMIATVDDLESQLQQTHRSLQKANALLAALEARFPEQEELEDDLAA